jgi:UDP-N-acetylglucosamine pyrophosphorylase
MFKRLFYTFYAKDNSFSVVETLKDGSVLYEKAALLPSQELPPRVKEFLPRQKLTQEQIEEMKTLRLQDPETNTVRRLAKNYNVLPSFVLKHTICPLERKLQIQKLEALQFEALPISKKVRQIDRIRRKALW